MIAGGAHANGWVVPVLGLFVATFAVNTAELIVAGLLPVIATDFSVSIPTAGLLITGYALGVAIASPVLSLLTNRLSRRHVLIVVMLCFVLGNFLCAISAEYWMLLIARLVVACCHGLFFGVATVLATRLAPEGRQATAVSLIIAGVTVANIAGVPIGTVIGNAAGWRAAFWVIALAGALAVAVLIRLIPSDPTRSRRAGDLGDELRAAVRPVVLLTYGIIAMFMLGTICVLGYIVPLLTTAVGVPQAYVPLVLFGMGFTGFFGNLIGGRLGDWNPAATMLGILCACIALLVILASILDNPWAAVSLIWTIWFIGFGFVAPARSRIIKAVRDAPNLASTLVSTAFNIGIAAGSALGGAALAAGWGYSSLPLIDAVALSVAALGTLVLGAIDRRHRAALATPT